MKAPSKLSASSFPGAKNRYDDFVVVHMQQTLSIHGTVSMSSFKVIKSASLISNELLRVTSYLGIGTLLGLMNKHFEANVAIQGLSQYVDSVGNEANYTDNSSSIGIGGDGLVTQKSLLSSTDRIPA